MTKCPWDEEGFTLPNDQPCPVCGALGSNLDDVQLKCIGYTGLSDEDLDVEGFGA